jgi:hypothetical protein
LDDLRAQRLEGAVDPGRRDVAIGLVHRGEPLGERAVEGGEIVIPGWTAANEAGDERIVAGQQVPAW